jgi:hypothetical protein
MKRPLRRQWYDAVDTQNAANELLVAKRRFLAGGQRARSRAQQGFLSFANGARIIAVIITWMLKTTH